MPPKKPSDDVDQMWTIEQVAERLQVDTRTIRRWCSQGYLEYVKFSPKMLRFKPEWIEDMIARKQGRRTRHRRSVA